MDERLQRIIDEHPGIGINRQLEQQQMFKSLSDQVESQANTIPFVIPEIQQLTPYEKQTPGPSPKVVKEIASIMAKIPKRPYDQYDEPGRV